MIYGKNDHNQDSKIICHCIIPLSFLMPLGSTSSKKIEEKWSKVVGASTCSSSLRKTLNLLLLSMILALVFFADVVYQIEEVPFSVLCTERVFSFFLLGLDIRYCQMIFLNLLKCFLVSFFLLICSSNDKLYSRFFTTFSFSVSLIIGYLNSSIALDIINLKSNN